MIDLNTGLPLLAQWFIAPLRIGTDVIGLFWALPICLSIAAVYKAIKLEHFTPASFIREVTLLFATIIGFLIFVSILLWIISYYSQQV